MACAIEEKDGLVEVHVTGETTPHELVAAVREIQRRYPRKEVSDLWLLSKRSLVPFVAFRGIVDAIARFWRPGTAASPSAIVAEDEFQRAQLELFRAEASSLPYPMGVFASREQAVAWLQGSAPRPE